MNYVLQGFGVFLGVIAGVAVNYLSALFLEKRKETQQTKNLSFELDFNIKKINTWLEEVVKYRNAVNGDALQNYYGYFDLSRVVSVTVNAMYQSGLLYQKLSKENVARLQIILSEFSLQGEQFMNSQILQAKQSSKEQWVLNKPTVVGQVDFWEKKFNDHRQTLQEILDTIE